MDIWDSGAKNTPVQGGFSRKSRAVYFLPRTGEVILWWPVLWRGDHVLGKSCFLDPCTSQSPSIGFAFAAERVTLEGAHTTDGPTAPVPLIPQSSAFLLEKGGYQDSLPAHWLHQRMFIYILLSSFRAQNQKQIPTVGPGMAQEFCKAGTEQPVHPQMRSFAGHHRPSRFNVWHSGLTSSRLAQLPEASRGFQRPEFRLLWGFHPTSWASPVVILLAQVVPSGLQRAAPTTSWDIGSRCSPCRMAQQPVILYFPEEEAGSWGLLESHGESCR